MNAKQIIPWVKHVIYEISKLIIGKCDKNWYVKNIQLEITYRCNKLCRNCNRHCNFTKLPYLRDTDMTIDQIKKFIKQIKQKNIRLKHIQILGGEPLLHPRLDNFISMLFYELMIPGNVSRIEIFSNGVIDSTDILKDCKLDPNIYRAFNDKKIVVIASPEGVEYAFRYILSAPVDSGFKWDTCSWPRECGVLLNTYGYWPGGACGPIALLFNKIEYAKYDFPVRFRDTWPNLKEDICRYCVTGCKELMYKKEGYVSQSYRKAISGRMRVPLIPKKF